VGDFLYSSCRCYIYTCLLSITLTNARHVFRIYHSDKPTIAAIGTMNPHDPAARESAALAVCSAGLALVVGVREG